MENHAHLHFVSINVTRHEKIGLMCTQNLATFSILNFNNFVDENNSLIKFPPFMQNFMGNLQNFIVKEMHTIIRRGVFCVHKPSFLMLSHK